LDATQILPLTGLIGKDRG